MLSILKTKAIRAAVAGHIIERYDVMLFGFLSSHLSTIFFPEEHFSHSILLTFGSFAAGYIMRPVGGIIFGYLGDKYGRKNALVCSIVFVTLPTVIIGILPGYNSIGITSPILLLLCRVMQGMCVAGEWAGASIYFYEHAPHGRKSSACGVMCATAFLGAVLATFIATICIMDSMPSWGWRIPFILGGLLGPISYLMRRKMEETNVFIEARDNKHLLKAPLFSVMKENKSALLAAMCVGIQGHIPLYLSTVYTNIVLTKTLLLSQWAVTLNNCCILLLWIVILLIASKAADIFGKERIMLISSIFISIISIPVYVYAYHYITFQSIILLQVVLTIAGASFLGPSSSLLPELFSVRKRYTGVGFGLTFGQAVIGGMTPMIATALVTLLNDPRAPALLLIFGGLISMFPPIYNLYTKSRVVKETV
jgi:MHS family proline/betaine transporter-like MFS transporter